MLKTETELLTLVEVNFDQPQKVKPVLKSVPAFTARKSLPAEAADQTKSEPLPGMSVPIVAPAASGRQAVTPEEIYIAELRAFLDKKKKYPALAKKMGQTGLVKIKFEIDRQGRVLSTEIAEASEFESLNKSAKSLIDQVQSFKPFPQFIVPIEYKL